MKTFLDRLTYLFKFAKARGGQLRGKRVLLLVTGFKPHPADCFEEMFRLTFEYLGIDYKGMGYCSTPKIFDFSKQKTMVDLLLNKMAASSEH